MKNSLFLIIAMVFASHIATAQEQKKYDWKNMKPDQRKEVIKNMSPDDRKVLLNQFRENMMISELDITQKDQDEFKNLYAEYQEKQNQIKSKFQPREDYEQMSDDDAQKQLNQSFEIGQQLLDNRKQYAQKFLKVIKPQQVLQLYQTEGKMRNRILDKKQDGQRQPRPQSR